MKIWVGALIVGGFFGAFTHAQTSGEPDVSGTWVYSSSQSVKWTFEEKDGKIHVQEANGDKIVADYTCPLNGQECTVKEDGHSEKVMIYFNGNKLVEIVERSDNDALKRRMTLSPDGKTMDVEVIPLSSSEKSEQVRFQRQLATGSNNKS